MLAASKNVTNIKGASRRQYGVIARGKERKVSNGYTCDADFTRRGFSRGVRMWHNFTEGGEPICDVCKRVGHVAKNCCEGKKSSLSSRRLGRYGADAKRVLHSVVKKRVHEAAVERYLMVSVNARQVEALIDFNAMENAVSLKTVKGYSKLKMYDLKDDRKANSPWLGALGMVWLPVVIGSRAEKLCCLVVDGLTEELIIGLPGLSFLGASINFSTGDVRIGRRRRKNVEGCTTVKKYEEVHDDHVLVREVEMKCTESKGTTKSKVVPVKKSPEGEVNRKECIKNQVKKRVKDLAENDDEFCCDGDHGKDNRKKPNQRKVNPVSGRGRKEGKVNVVSPALQEQSNIIPDHHDYEISDSESESGDEDMSEHDEVKICGNGNAKVGKRSRKAKHKKGKKKKGKKRK